MQYCFFLFLFKKHFHILVQKKVKKFLCILKQLHLLKLSLIEIYFQFLN
jgi:hypothetical protein